jgi:hypothetical protein
MSHAHDHSNPTLVRQTHATARRRGGEDYAARAHPEFVVLEIGDHVGALIVHTDADLHGVEIEICPEGEDCRRSHKQVLERSVNGSPAFTAVFDGLRVGSYSLWLRDQRRARGVSVRGGSITTLDWRVATRQPAARTRVRRSPSAAVQSPARAA